MSDSIFGHALLATWVNDARGRRVRLIRRSAMTAKEQWRMHAAWPGSPRVRRAGVLALLIALPAFALPGLVVPLLTPVIVGAAATLGVGRIALAVLVGALAGVAGPLAMVLVARRLLASEIARFMVGAGACASCDYPLAGVPEAVDGCTVCPECGSAWRRDEQGSSP